MLPRRQRILLASLLAVASIMLLLAGAYAQSQSKKTTLPAAAKATFDARGVATCPAGYVYDASFPPASACRIQTQHSGNGACPSGYARQGDGSCALESVKANNGQCPASLPVFDKSSNRCKVCTKPPKDPSKKCKHPDLNGDCDPKKCG